MRGSEMLGRPVLGGVYSLRREQGSGNEYEEHDVGSLESAHFCCKHSDDRMVEVSTAIFLWTQRL